MDLLAAYKHYEEFGKKEGRDGRSEAVVRAEQEAAARAREEAAARAQAEAVTSTQEEDVNDEEEDRDDRPSEPEKKSFEIQSVEVTGSGHIRVTLNQRTEQPLALEAFSIICNSGGSDMTILSVTTNDNMVYDLTTTYYRDQEYDLQITLADGTTISKVFVYRTDCAQIAGINAVRTSGSEARISYNSNEPGSFYYLLRENSVSRESEEVTESEIIESGIKTEMKQHENSFTISGLTEGMPYTMYYVAVNTEGNATLVKSLSIDKEVYEETAAAIKRADAFAEKQENGEFLYGFEIELENATQEPLTLEQFDISCPLNETTLGEVSTSDNRVYRVYMQRGSIPTGNNTYTILITLKDGTQLRVRATLTFRHPGLTQEVLSGKMRIR